MSFWQIVFRAFARGLGFRLGSDTARGFEDLFK